MSGRVSRKGWRTADGGGEAIRGGCVGILYSDEGERRGDDGGDVMS